MMASSTIILWGRDDVLRRSIELFLSENENLEVITVSETEDPERLLLIVDEMEPKAVIMHLGDSSCTENFRNVMVYMMQRHPGIKVITISLENNIIEIFNKQDVHISAVEDLISAVEG